MGNQQRGWLGGVGGRCSHILVGKSNPGGTPFPGSDFGARGAQASRGRRTTGEGGGWVALGGDAATSLGGSQTQQVPLSPAVTFLPRGKVGKGVTGRCWGDMQPPSWGELLRAPQSPEGQLGKGVTGHSRGTCNHLPGGSYSAHPSPPRGSWGRRSVGGPGGDAATFLGGVTPRTLVPRGAVVEGGDWAVPGDMQPPSWGELLCAPLVCSPGGHRGRGSLGGPGGRCSLFPGGQLLRAPQSPEGQLGKGVSGQSRGEMQPLSWGEHYSPTPSSLSATAAQRKKAPLPLPTALHGGSAADRTGGPS